MLLLMMTSSKKKFWKKKFMVIPTPFSYYDVRVSRQNNLKILDYEEVSFIPPVL